MSHPAGKRAIAVVGTGYWGKNLVRNFNRLGALHTICDADPDIVRTFAEQYPGIRGVTSYTEVLQDPGIHGIVIATPASMHADMVSEAILAGKDVYVEKPLCLSELEGRELVELAAAHKRILMVGHLLWYHPVVVRLQELVDAGELGRIQYIYSNRLNLGKLRREENVLWSFAPHDISVILGLVKEMPESLQSQGGNYLHRRIADTTITALNFASGIRAHIFVSWLHPYKEQKLVVVGDRKMAVFDDTLPWEEKLRLYPHTIGWDGDIPTANKAEAELERIQQDEPLRAECEHFLECLATRRKPKTDGEEGLLVIRVLNACQAALENGQPFTFLKERSPAAGFIHPTAVIDRHVRLGEGTKIWHFSHILSDTTIGEKCNIGQNVMIGPNVSVGQGCKIQNNVSIYEGVELEDFVFCGPSMVFTNVYNPRSEISKKDEFRRTLVKRGATIGANATIVCGITVGRYSFIGAGAVINRNVADHALVVGNPGRQIGWVCECGERLGDDLTCDSCDRKYSQGKSGLESIS